ncbi:MAG TPA: Rrf2 family transcriptional regulator, partial [Flavobacteriales bacterium]|nr:Rrf2 family transcriptional regulator [Flavobacteriales bacterium]
LELKRAGYVGSKQGFGGGYYLKIHPKKITVADVYRLFDGAIALVPCVAVKYYERCDDCKDEKICGLRAEFLKIKDKTRDVMKKSTISSFLKTR